MKKEVAMMPVQGVGIREDYNDKDSSQHVDEMMVGDTDMTVGRTKAGSR